MAKCSFCGTTSRLGEHVLVGPSGVGICANCAKKVLEMFEPDGEGEPAVLTGMPKQFWKQIAALTPGKIKAELDKCVVGQEETKKVLSVAVYNHYRRLAAEIPEGMLLVETDRTKDGEGPTVREVLAELARIRGADIAALEALTDENAKSLFANR